MGKHGFTISMETGRQEEEANQAYIFPHRTCAKMQSLDRYHSVASAEKNYGRRSRG